MAARFFGYSINFSLVSYYQLVSALVSIIERRRPSFLVEVFR
jgi:hypothetical protein